VPDLPDAILFDADGTLYNSEHLQFEATRRAARKLHGFDFTWELFETHMLKGTKSGHHVLLEQGFDSDDGAYHHTKQEFFERLVADELTTMPGVVDFLRWCERKSIICIVVSGARGSQVKAALKAVGINGFFKHVIAHEDVEGMKKPEPHPYLLGLKLSKVRARRAMAVEDTEKGIASAKAAGLYCVGIRNGTNSRSELSAADLIISDYRELRSHLAGHA
jgi:HAD superfamily hydrolase (TIGR01509 family)